MKNKPLIAIDALGRRVPAPETGCTRRKDRLTGLFYFLWLETGTHRLYNISEITEKDPRAGYKPDSGVWGRVADYHFWGEPFYGYYAQSDEWVVRKHMKQLIAADLDFLFFDTTNADIFEPNAKLVMKVLQEYQDDGFRTPQVMFYTNTKSGETVQEIYEKIYKPGYCPGTWFCLDGKPVIVARPEECSEEARRFFQIKLSQWPNEPSKAGGWPWMDFTRPQRLFYDREGRPEIMNVSVAQHPQMRFGDSVLYGETGNCGRAYHDGRNDPERDAYIKGYNFAEQFERALEADPPIVLITGWNEWIAGRWPGPPERPLMFVDCANYEYSRDLEPMKGGYFDNYYLQLLSYVRKYKGCEGVPETPAGTPVRYDSFSDGQFERDAMGWNSRYTNHTQRNAIRAITVSHTREAVTFEIETAAPIRKDGGGSFLSLYLSLGECAGYDFIVSPSADSGVCTASAMRVLRGAPDGTPSRPCDDLRETEPVGTVPFTLTANTLTACVPLAMLGLRPERFELWFKAADSTKGYERIDQFYEDGDAAPIGRLNYLYRGCL